MKRQPLRFSRTDAFLGNNHAFNQTVFDTSKVYWTEPILTAEMLANSKLYRQIESRASNPNYTFTQSTEAFSLGEVAAPIIVFGDHGSATVNKTLVEYFFGKSTTKQGMACCFWFNVITEP